MSRVNYFDIISNIPYSYEVDYLESEMKLAGRDHFCKPQTFIRELTQALDELKSDLIHDATKKKSELERDIKTAYDYSNEPMYYHSGYNKDVAFQDETGVHIRKAITYDEYHKRETERRIQGYKSRLERVVNDIDNHIKVFNYWHSKVKELEQIIQADDDDIQQADDPQQNGKLYEIDNTLFKMIYKHCQDRDMFNIDEAEFLQRIARADLSGEIYNKGNKTKINIIIKMIKEEKAICESWYTEAVENLDTTKQKLTKVKDDKLEVEIKAIIDEWRKTRKEFNDRVKSKIKSLNPT